MYAKQVDENKHNIILHRLNEAVNSTWIEIYRLFARYCFIKWTWKLCLGKFSDRLTFIISFCVILYK